MCKPCKGSASYDDVAAAAAGATSPESHRTNGVPKTACHYRDDDEGLRDVLPA